MRSFLVIWLNINSDLISSNARLHVISHLMSPLKSGDLAGHSMELLRPLNTSYVSSKELIDRNVVEHQPAEKQFSCLQILVDYCMQFQVLDAEWSFATFQDKSPLLSTVSKIKVPTI